MVCLVEWVSVAGLESARRLLGALETRVTTRAEAVRVRFLLKFLDAVDRTYGPPAPGPFGHLARPLRTVYAQVREGRSYCRAAMGPAYEDGAPSYICVQGMPSALRPLLMGAWARDIDIENCHVVIMHQLALSMRDDVGNDAADADNCVSE